MFLTTLLNFNIFFIDIICRRISKMHTDAKLNTDIFENHNKDVTSMPILILQNKNGLN